MVDNRNKKAIVKIKLANSKDIERWANGNEVTESETLNYRTLKPVTKGLFCSKIFGTMYDYECICGRYKGFKYDGVVCEKCETKVSSSDVRRENMGYIKLPVPMIHPWFTRKNNKIAALLNISLKDLKKIYNLEKYVVLKPGKTELKYFDMISISEYEKYMIEDNFEAETGGVVLKKLLSKIDLAETIKDAKVQIENNSSTLVKKKYSYVIEVCNDMLGSGVRPEDMIIESIAIIPPDHRPLVEIEGGKFVSADINDLYRMCIYRIKRLKSLIENQITLPLILHNEIRILQDGINNLFGSGSDSEGKDITKRHKSIEDRLKGKEGSFRKSILGKRVDYSGRSAIVVAPDLDLDYCYIPREMALEILKPMVNGYLRTYGFCTTIKEAKRLIKKKTAEVWDILTEISKKNCPFVLLNRAPTLHRVGIMGFRYKLWDKKCIGLNPLVCKAFNADFDGDQMAVHFPLSQEAIAETLLMMPSNNMGSATDGSLLVMISKDIVMGVYYLTLAKEKNSDSCKPFTCSEMSEIDTLLESKSISLNDYIKYYDRETQQLHETTAGRVILWSIIPRNDNISFELIDKNIKSKNVHELMKTIRLHCGEKALKKFVDEIKNLGFKYANYYTGSIGFKDFFEIPGGEELISNTIEKQKNLNSLLDEGLITSSEIKKKSNDLWKETTKTGKDLLVDLVNKNPFNPMATIAQSGARGSLSQLSQMLFMKGNVTDISGDFSAIPISRGHKKGLTMSEYFLLSFGARKGVADVAIKTAEAGYLTRRLVDVANGCVVNAQECGSTEYLTIQNVFKNGQLQSTIYDQILTRTSACDVFDPVSGDLIVGTNQLIDEHVINKLMAAEITEINIRSPVLCKLEKGVCVKCYGGDISTVNQFVNEGEAVGVIAAQSIGEPGTQLTMRSFHSGGVASFGDQKEEIECPFSGILKYEKIQLVENREKEMINISRDGQLFIKNKYNFIVAKLDVPYGSTILVKNNTEVTQGEILAKWKAETPIIAETDGEIETINLQKGINCEYTTEEETQEKKLIINNSKGSPAIILKSKEGYEINYFLPINTIIMIEKGKIKRGDKIAYTLQSDVAIDIVGGLQKVINILENRAPTKMGILSKWNGVVHIKNDKKGKVILNIKDDNDEEHEIFTGNAEIAIQNGLKIQKGDQLTVGTPTLQDVLDSKGLTSLTKHFITELQGIYIEHGIQINNKHLEVILTQMCKKHTITEDYKDYIQGKVFDIIELNKLNKELKEKHKNPIGSKQLVSGITAASLGSVAFLSSASFQETITILTNSSIKGASDDLSMIKSSIIAGSVIKAGTGYALDKFNEMSKKLLDNS